MQPASFLYAQDCICELLHQYAGHVDGATDEQFDINNAEAVNAIYDNINNAVETINVSLVMSK